MICVMQVGTFLTLALREQEFATQPGDVGRAHDGRVVVIDEIVCRSPLGRPRFARAHIANFAASVSGVAREPHR